MKSIFDIYESIFDTDLDSVPTPFLIIDDAYNGASKKSTSSAYTSVKIDIPFWKGPEWASEYGKVVKSYSKNNTYLVYTGTDLEVIKFGSSTSSCIYILNLFQTGSQSNEWKGYVYNLKQKYPMAQKPTKTVRYIIQLNDFAKARIEELNDKVFG